MDDMNNANNNAHDTNDDINVHKTHDDTNNADINDVQDKTRMT